MYNTDASVYVFYTLVYCFFSLCFIAPPAEFVNAGLTIQALFSSYLGSEDVTFVQYHIKRTAFTAAFHSLLPLGEKSLLTLYVRFLYILCRYYASKDFRGSSSLCSQVELLYRILNKFS